MDAVSPASDRLDVLRSSEMHEATRRLLGVLLRQLDGFGPQSKSIVVGATNRRQDLDPALLSRFDAAVTFGLPSEENRYACRSLLGAITMPSSRAGNHSRCGVLV